MSAYDDNSPQGFGGIPPADSIWTPVRQELRLWFREKAPALALAYEGAVELLRDTAFPGRVHFIAHACRDIADRLVFVLDPQTEGKRVQYENELDVIAEQWPSLDHLYDADANAVPLDTVALPAALIKRIDGLVGDHRSRRKRPSQYELLFQFLIRTHPLPGAVNPRIVKAFKAVRERFMKWAHFPSTVLDEVNENELRGAFESFERMLHSFVGSFFTGTSELDEILHQANQ